MHQREPLASVASWISADYLDFQLSFPPSSPAGACQECLLSLDSSLLGEVSYARPNLPRGLDSAPCPPVTVTILLSSESEYCLSAGHWHLPEPHLSWVTLDLHRPKAESPHQSHEIKGHSVLPFSRRTSLSPQGPFTGFPRASDLQCPFLCFGQSKMASCLKDIRKSQSEHRTLAGRLVLSPLGHFQSWRLPTALLFLDTDV